MNMIGHVILVIVAFLWVVLLLIFIPEFLGRKFGLWITRTFSRSQANSGKDKVKHAFLKLDDFPWWCGLAAVAAVEAVIMLLVILDVPNIPPQRPPFTVYIYRSMLAQQFSEPVYVIVYSMLMVVAFFIVGLLNTLRVMPKSNSAGRGSE